MNSQLADIAVVGGGIIGASIAWRIAQAGSKATLLDAGAVGGEASWAGAGMLAPGGEMERRSPLTDFCLESLALYPGFVEELRQESGVAIDYRQCGAMDVAFTAEEWAALEARAAVQREVGIVSEALDASARRGLEATLGREVVGALRYPGDAVVDPRHVMSALRAACERRGVEIRERQRVSAIHARGAGVEIEAGAARFTAGGAVLAAGAWSGEIAVWIENSRLPVPASFPVKGHLLGYRLEPGSVGTILRHGHTYILQRASGFTVAGSSAQRVGFDRAIDRAVTADIHARACELLAGLRHAAPPEAWVGFRPATEGLKPEIRRVEGTAVWLCYGHYRNGILLAPGTARRVSREIIASWEKDSASPRGSL